MFTVSQIKTHLRAIPPPLRFGAGGFIMLLVVLLLLSHRGTNGPRTPSAEPAAQLKPVAAPLASHATTSAKPSVAGSVGIPTSPTPAASTAGVALAAITPASLMLPAQPAPANLVRGTSTRTLSAAPSPASFPVAWPTDWTPVAKVIEHTPTASWTTEPGKDLHSLVPSNGLVNNTWTMWTHVENSGEQTLVFRQIEGPARNATVTIDAAASPAIDAARTACFSTCDQDTVSVANTNLAAGWHQITVQIVQKAVDGPTGADLYLRGPADPMPVAIVPFTPVSNDTPFQVSP